MKQCCVVTLKQTTNLNCILRHGDKITQPSTKTYVLMFLVEFVKITNKVFPKDPKPWFILAWCAMCLEAKSRIRSLKNYL